MNIKNRIFVILNKVDSEDALGKIIHWFITGLIILSVVSVILKTEKSLITQFNTLFVGFEIFTTGVFTIEYILRLWVCTIDPKYSSPVLGRIKYAFSPLALIDLIAILPFYLPSSRLDLRFFRAVRLTFIFRILKLGHYSQSLRTLGKVMKSKKEELLVTLFGGAILLVIASSLMYYIERDAQPDKFDSILSAMWWGVSALTTIGYGDIYPLTPLGKIVGSIIAVLGVGLFVLPAGIFASGFAEEVQHKKEKPTICPHCGNEINTQNK